MTLCFTAPSPRIPMTLPNKITIGRILLIPVFIAFASYYGESIKAGEPNESWRYAAVLVFFVASVSDAVDGFIARHFNQKSRLGVLLDPLADKALLLSALITLTVTEWPVTFPIWFPVLVIARDAVLVGGAFIINHLVGHVSVQPHLSGKACTFFQMVAVAWVMLQIETPSPIYAIAIAGILTAISGTVYVMDGVRQLQETGHAHANE